MKRQRVRSEEYRARRWKLKAKRRQRRDPDAQKGIFTQDDQVLLGLIPDPSIQVSS